MLYFDDANELVRHTENQLSKINKVYKQSLHEKSIKPELLIKIKNLMENLRSALDFVAHGLFSKYGDPTKTKSKIYFAYATENQTKTEFQNRNIIEKCIPGLIASRPDIRTIIESHQHFSSFHFLNDVFMVLEKLLLSCQNYKT